jgi:hypothetical protein
VKTLLSKSAILDSITSLWAQLYVAVRQPLTEDEDVACHQNIDPDFDRWLYGDPFVTRNPASRYGERSPGYMTGNGFGSLEVGAVDD